jgi:uncharacterized protein (TIGR01777 family)
VKNILITGGTGLVGSKLIPTLQAKGYKVSILSRSKQESNLIKTYVWNIAEGILPQEAVDEADVIVHLAGANVGTKKWTASRKQEIIDSRVKSGELLLDKIKKSKSKPEAFITASAVGYYGLQTSEKIFSENDPPADDFFGEVGKAWESVLEKTNNVNIRSVAMRIGVVLAQEDGALPKMSIPLKFGFGTQIGSGKQYIPWIHIDDIVSMFLMAIENGTMHGAFNAVAPEHITNRGFMKKLCQIRKRIFIPIGAPSFLLKLVLGEMAGIVLEGSRASSNKIVEAGFTFEYPNLSEALKSLA